MRAIAETLPPVEAGATTTDMAAGSRRGGPGRRRRAAALGILAAAAVVVLAVAVVADPSPGEHRKPCSQPRSMSRLSSRTEPSSRIPPGSSCRMAPSSPSGRADRRASGAPISAPVTSPRCATGAWTSAIRRKAWSNRPSGRRPPRSRRRMARAPAGRRRRRHTPRTRAGPRHLDPRRRSPPEPRRPRARPRARRRQRPRRHSRSSGGRDCGSGCWTAGGSPSPGRRPSAQEATSSSDALAQWSGPQSRVSGVPGARRVHRAAAHAAAVPGARRRRGGPAAGDRPAPERHGAPAQLIVTVAVPSPRDPGHPAAPSRRRRTPPRHRCRRPCPLVTRRRLPTRAAAAPGASVATP